ncbi:MAG: NAD(P)/FAD-dependent oxidoreductase, partial [Chloroflexia bacterium]|nr:NAD(P)/FAD-dependent oxidoreductase [Chloroflexia bacterium]
MPNRLVRPARRRAPWRIGRLTVRYAIRCKIRNECDSADELESEVGPPQAAYRSHIAPGDQDVTDVIATPAAPDIVTESIVDITIIGAGPTGLFAAFYAGLRGASVQIIDSLEEVGGQCSAMYPEKYIYDVIGYPKVMAKEFVAACLEQALRSGPTIHLREQVQTLEPLADGTFTLHTTHGQRRSRSVIIAAGVGAFEPTRLGAPGVEYLEGKGIHYFAKHIEDFRDRNVVIVGGGDSAVDWAMTLEPIAKTVNLIHRSKFRAHEAMVDDLEASTVTLHYPGYEVIDVRAGDHGRISGLTFRHLEGHTHELDVDELICAIGFKADPGPIKSWNLELQRNQIVADQTSLQTSVPGVFAAGDIATYPAKFKLIATGAGEAVTAVNHAVQY